jgi:hypothetical protein
VRKRQLEESDRAKGTHSLEIEGRELSGHGKNPTDRGALTSWRRQREEPVRTRKGPDRPRRTHFLETAEGGTCQGTERSRSTKAHSLPGESGGRELSGHRKKATKRDGLTNWRRERKGPVRTRKENDRLRRTHKLETAQGGACQDT